MKKKIFGLVAFGLGALSIAGLTACNSNEVQLSELDQQRKAIYELAAQSGFDGTYEEWLASIMGDSIELRLNGGKVEWKYKLSSTWTTLISLDTIKGQNGNDGVSITNIEKTGSADLVDTYTITFSNGTTSTYTVTNGDKGDAGNGIASILKTSSEGLVDTYTVTFTDQSTTTFTITNGAVGEVGNGIAKIEKGESNGLVDTYVITFTSGVTTSYTVANGNGIDKVEKTNSEGLVDTYTIYFTNGTTSTFEIKNGASGNQGAKVEFKMDSTCIMYKYENEETWTTLANLNDIYPAPKTDEYTEGLAFLDVAGKGLYVYGYYGTETEVVIPEVYEGKNVVGISANAFANTEVTKITLPKSVSYVAPTAFNNATVTFAKDFEEIPANMFKGNTTLTSVLVPGTVKTVCESAFENCTNLSKVVLSEGVETIETYAFRRSNSIKEFYMPKSLTLSKGEVFRDDAFQMEEGFNVYYGGTLDDWFKITFESTSASPMYYATDLYLLDSNNEYKALREVTISKDMTDISSIRNNLLGLFTNVEKLVVEEGNTAFDSRDNSNAIIDSTSNTLLYATKGTKVIPATVTTIATRAFFMINGSQTDLVIPETVKTLKESAFRSCKLNSLTLPNGIDAENYALRYLDVEYINDKGMNILGKGVLENCRVRYLESTNTLFNRELKYLVGIKYNINKDKYFSINLESIKHSPNLEAVYFNFTDEDDVRKNYKTATLYWYDDTSDDYSERAVSVVDITDPEKVAEAIKAISSLDGKYYIGSISAAEYKVEKETDGFAFIDVAGEGLYVYNYYGDKTTLTIPQEYEGKKIIGIASKAFANSSVEKIYLSKNIKTIASDAFENSNVVVSFDSSVTKFDTSLFMNNLSLTSIVIPSTIKSIPESAFEGCVNLKNVVLSEGVEEINTRAFRYCANMESFYFPKSLKDLNGDIFRDEKWQIEENLSVYYNGTFEDWCNINFESTSPMYYAANIYFKDANNDYKVLREVTISKDMTTLNINALRGLFTNVEKITVEEGNTVYDSRNNCNAIVETETNTILFACKNTIIDESITTLGERSYFMVNLSNVDLVIPSTVKTIKQSAFRSCKFNSITIAKDTTLEKEVFNWATGDTLVFEGKCNMNSNTLKNLNVINLTTHDYKIYGNLNNLTNLTIVREDNVCSFYISNLIQCTNLSKVKIDTSNSDIIKNSKYVSFGTYNQETESLDSIETVSIYDEELIAELLKSILLVLK